MCANRSTVAISKAFFASAKSDCMLFVPVHGIPQTLYDRLILVQKNWLYIPLSAALRGD